MSKIDQSPFGQNAEILIEKGFVSHLKFSNFPEIVKNCSKFVWVRAIARKF
jgi:hypothetical protein